MYSVCLAPCTLRRIASRFWILTPYYLLPAACCPPLAGYSCFTDLFLLLLFNADSEIRTAYLTPSAAYAELWFRNLRLPFFIHCQHLFRAKRRTDAAPFAPVPIELHLKLLLFGFGLGFLILDLCLLRHFAFRGLGFLCFCFAFSCHSNSMKKSGSEGHGSDLSSDLIRTAFYFRRLLEQ